MSAPNVIGGRGALEAILDEKGPAQLSQSRDKVTRYHIVKILGGKTLLRASEETGNSFIALVS